MSFQNLRANPSGAAVRAGEASFHLKGNDLIIRTGSNRLILDWDSFSLDAGDLTRFVQPGVNAAVLNRVTGPASSFVNGDLLANGQLYLINPNGVMIGPNGRVEASTFAASTLDVEDADFLDGGDMTFAGNSDASVVNLGSISAMGGDVFLFGRSVVNAGEISAPEGTVGLGAGQEVLLKASGDERIVINPSGKGKLEETGIDNSGVITAATAELKANGGNVYALAIKNSGRIRATGAVSTGGRVFLVGGRSSDVRVEGDGSVIAERGEGLGGISVSAAKVEVLDSAVIEGVDQKVEIAASDMEIGSSASISSGSADLVIAGNGAEIQLGTVSSGFGLSNSEIARISAGDLEVSSSGGVRIVDLTVHSGITGAVKLSSPGSQITIGGTKSSFENAGGLTVGGPNQSVVVSSDVLSVGGQRYLSHVEIGSDVRFEDTNGSAISFLAGADGRGADAWYFDVITSGEVSLRGEFGSVNPFNGFLFDGGGTLKLQDAGFHSVGNTIIFNTPVTLTSDTAFTDGGGNIIFNNTVDGDGLGPWNLTVNNPGGHQTQFNGAVGSLFPLASITTDAAGTTVINANITTIGSQTFNDPVTLGSNAILTSTGSGAITFNQSVDGPHILDVRTAGSTVFNGSVGGVGALSSLVTDAGGTTQIGSNVTTTGSQVFNDAVALLGATILTSSGDAAIALNGTVNGGFSLLVNTGGTTTFGGVVGGTTPLASLETNAGGTTQIASNVTTTGNQVFNDAVTLSGASILTGDALTVGNGLNGGGNNLTLTFAQRFDLPGGLSNINNFSSNGSGGTGMNGAFSTSGSQTYGNAVTLLGATTLTSSGGAAIALNGTVNGGFSLLVNTAGATTFGGVVGGTTPLASLETNAGGTTQIASNVTTTGNQVYNDAVTLSGDAVLEGDGLTLGNGLSGGGNSLTLTFSQQVALTGNVSGVSDFTSNGSGGTSLNGSFSTSGAQTFGNAVTLLGATTLTSSGDAAIALNGTVNGGFSLLVNTGGATTFGGVVGGTTPLSSLETNTGGTTQIASNVTTTGNQIFNDAVTLSGDSVLEGDGLTLGNGLNGGGNSLTLTFDQRFDLPGGLSNINNFTSNGSGGTGLNGSFSTIGSQTYGNAVILLADSTISSSGDAAIALNGTVNGDFSLLVNTAGATTFGGVVGGTDPLARLETNPGGTTQIASNVTTTGDQVFNDAVTLSGNSVLEGDGLTLGNGLNGGNHNLTLTFSQQVALPGGISGVVDFISNGTGGTSLNGIFSTIGSQTYGNAVSLLGPSTLTSSGNANISLNGTVDGDFSLLVNTTGVTRFGGVVGGTAPLASLETNTGGETQIASNIRTVGNQVFNDAVTLTGNSVLEGGGLTLGNGLSGGNHNLTLTFSQQVALPGGISGVVDFISNGTGGTGLNGVFLTGGSQTYGNSVTLLADSTVTSSGNGNISFLGTVDGGSELFVNTGGTTLFDAVVGGSDPLARLETDAPGNTQIKADVTTTGLQVYNDRVNTGGVATLTLTAGPAPGGITFGSSLDGLTDVTLDTSGSIEFNGLVGNTTALQSLATKGGGDVLFSASESMLNPGNADFTVKTTGSQEYSGSAEIYENTFLFSSGGDIQFGAGIVNQGGNAIGVFVENAGSIEVTGNIGAALNPFGVVTLQSGADLALGDTSVFSNQVSLVSLNGGISKAAGTLQGETIAFDSNGAVNLAEGVTNFSRVAGTAAGNILLKDPDSIEVSSLSVLRASGVSENLEGISTSGNIGITTVGDITSTARISANELNAKSDGAQTLLTKVDRLISDAASLTVEERDSIDLIDIDASSISVRAGGRINARDLSGARISLESTGGGIEIGSAVATRSLRLTSTGAITQTGPLSTSDLVLASGSFINLSNARNTIKTLGNVSRGGDFRLTDSEGGLNLVGKIAGNSNSSVRLVTRGGLSLLRGAEIEVSGAGNQLVLVANDDGARGEFTSKAGSSALKTGPGTDTFIFSTSIKGSEYDGLLADYFIFQKTYPDAFPVDKPALSGNRGYSVGFIFDLFGDEDPDLLALSNLDFDILPTDSLTEDINFLTTSEENSEELRDHIAKLKEEARAKAVENPEHITIGPFELLGYEFELWSGELETRGMDEFAVPVDYTFYSEASSRAELGIEQSGDDSSGAAEVDFEYFGDFELPTRVEAPALP